MYVFRRSKYAAVAWRYNRLEASWSNPRLLTLRIQTRNWRETTLYFRFGQLVPTDQWAKPEDWVYRRTWRVQMDSQHMCLLFRWLSQKGLPAIWEETEQDEHGHPTFQRYGIWRWRSHDVMF